MSRSIMAPSGPEKPVVSLDRERERTVELLSQHFAHDNLSLEELERRMTLVYAASSMQALRELTRDLPTEGAAVAPRPATPLPPAFLPESGRIVSFMAQTRRKGPWQPPRTLHVWSIMSETHLDLTEAQLQSGVTEIKVHALMTSMKIIVARGVRVVVQPSAFMAEVDDDAIDQPAVGSGAPVVRITGPVVMAELKVSVRTRERLSTGEDF